MNDLSPLERVRAYYRDLNTGDPRRSRATSTPTRTTTTRGSARTERAGDRGADRAGRQAPRRELAPRARDRAGRRGRDRVDDAVARPAPRQRAAARPRHGVVPDRGDGLIAEVRAYHHSDEKNPQGDLLGFDHAGRGYTTLEQWDEVRERDGAGPDATTASARERATSTRHLIPPFTEEHEALRESLRSFVEREIHPHAHEWEAAQEFPRELFTRMGELGFLGLKYPEEYGGQGGDYVHDAVFSEEMARCGSGGVAAGIGGHVGIATPPIFKFGTEEQKQRWLVPAIKGEKIAALAITEPGAGSDVAGHQDLRAPRRRRVRRERLEDLHHERRARRHLRHRGEDHRGGRPPRHLVPRAREREWRASRSRASSRSSAGTRPTPASSRSPTCACRRRTCSARRTRAST